MPKISIFFYIVMWIQKIYKKIFDAGCSSCTKYCVLREFSFCRKIICAILHKTRCVWCGILRKTCSATCANDAQNVAKIQICAKKAQILRKKYGPSAKTLVWMKRFFHYLKFIMLCRKSTLFSCFPAE